MKGNNLYVLVLLACTVGLVFVMYILSGGSLMSWSIADTTALAFMLRMILAPISRLQWKFAEHHVNRETFLFRMDWLNIDFPKWYKPKISLGKTDITLKEAFEVSGWLFMGIIIFGMAGPWYVKSAHWIVTGLAAASQFIIIVRSTPKGIKRTLYIVGLSIGTGVWVIGILTKLWSVYLGEAAYLVTPVIFYISEIVNKKINQNG